MYTGNILLQPLTDPVILWRIFQLCTWNGSTNIIADINLFPKKSLLQRCKCVALNKGCDNCGYKFKLWHASVIASSCLDIKQDFSVVQSKGTGKHRPLSMTAVAPAGQEAASSEDENTHASCVSGRTWVHLGNINSLVLKNKHASYPHHQFWNWEWGLKALDSTETRWH